MKFDFRDAALTITSSDSNDVVRAIETAAQARQARDRLVIALKETGAPGQKLARRLASCSLGACRSAACPICLRHFRIWWASEITAYMEQDSGPWFTVNIVPSNEARPVGELSRFQWNKLKGRLRKQIDRSELQRATIIGGFDYSLQMFGDGRSPKWRPHMYFLTSTGGKRLIEMALCDHYAPDDDTPKPVRVTVQKPALKDRIATSTYTFKSFFYERRPGVDRRGNADTDHQRLAPAHQAELALLLDQQGFLGRMIRRGSDTLLPLLTTR